MLKKNCVFSISVFSLLLLLMGCRHIEPPKPTLFTPVDCWDVISIDGKNVMDYFAFFDGDLSVMETKILQNDLCFFKNGSWFWTLNLEIEADMGGGLILKSQIGLAGKGSYDGDYTPTGGTITMAQEKLEIRLEPEDFWLSAGITEQAFRDEVTKSWLFGQIDKWRASAIGPSLTLTNSATGIQQVLQRQ